jgi:hypothetical protein
VKFSREITSGTVLQTALCYLEAIQQKVPELARKEKEGEGVSSEMDVEERPIMSDDLPDTEADATGMRMSFDSVIRTEICATLPVDFDDNAMDGISLRLIFPYQAHRHFLHTRTTRHQRSPIEKALGPFSTFTASTPPPFPSPLPSTSVPHLTDTRFKIHSGPVLFQQGLGKTFRTSTS